MAVDLKEKGTVGCCYYVAREEKMYFMEEVKLGGIDVVDICESLFVFMCNLSNFSTVKVYIEPTIILVSSKVDDAVIDKFDPEARSGTSDIGSRKYD
jgi:DNA mismatch repair protein MSH5